MKGTLVRAALLAVVVFVAAFGTGPALAEDFFAFEGSQTYWYRAEKTHEVLEDTACPVSATLTFLGGRDVMLMVSEYLPCLPNGRQFPLFGKMTPSGSIKLWFPSFIPIVDILKEHSGCSVAGPFPKYHGQLQDGILHVETHFTQQCENGLFGFPVEGPVHGKWILHLGVVVVP